MFANALSAGFAAIFALIVFLKRRHDRVGRTFSLVAAAFTFLVYDILTIGREMPVSPGIVLLATAVIAMAADFLGMGERVSSCHHQPTGFPNQPVDSTERKDR